jgi:hypothetical protein
LLKKKLCLKCHKPMSTGQEVMGVLKEALLESVPLNVYLKSYLDIKKCELYIPGRVSSPGYSVLTEGRSRVRVEFYMCSACAASLKLDEVTMEVKEN